MKMLAPRLRHRIDIQSFEAVQDSNTGAISEEWVSLFGNGSHSHNGSHGQGHGQGHGHGGGGPPHNGDASSNAFLLPAEIYPMSGREFVAAQSIQAGVNTKITIRWMDGIKPSMRVLHGDQVYNIRAVLPDPTLRRHITLMCESGANNG